MAKDATVDPRVTRTRHAVLAAAREVLLDEGWEGVTLGRVAERSGYARTTLYRHWPQRLDLLRDLIREEARLAHTTPMGDLRDDLVAELEAFRVAVTSTGLGRVMIAIGQQARDDAELADLNRSMRAEGARVLDMTATSDRVVLRVAVPGSGERLYFLNPATGAVAGILEIGAGD